MAAGKQHCDRLFYQCKTHALTMRSGRDPRQWITMHGLWFPLGHCSAHWHTTSNFKPLNETLRRFLQFNMSNRLVSIPSRAIHVAKGPYLNVPHELYREAGNVYPYSPPLTLMTTSEGNLDSPEWVVVESTRPK